MATATAYEHIKLNDNGVPIIAGTGMKVICFIEAQVANDYSPSELQEQYPHLTMAEIYSALAYYWDHKSDMDAEMQRRDESVEEMRRSAQPSPLLEKLRAAKYRK